jgi:DNA-binding transcriptional ArsR family regulator
MTYLSALPALADPTRRAVFERLHRAPASVNEIAAGLPVTRPAVSQHLKALLTAGLIAARSEGNRRVYSVDPAGLEELRHWLNKFWRGALEAFREKVEKSLAARRKQIVSADIVPARKPSELIGARKGLSKFLQSRGN